MQIDVEYDVQLDTVRTGFDGKTCWVQCRAGTIPAMNGRMPIVVLTKQKLLLSGSDIFYELNELRTDDMGASWTGPVPHETLGRRKEPDGVDAVICDATPRWHAATGTLLSTGHVARYKGDHIMPDPRPRQTAYSAYDAEARTWRPWACLEMPDEDGRFFSVGAGSAQRYDLPNGDILLPVYAMSRERAEGKLPKRYEAMVLRCRFDGTTLRFIEHGNGLRVDEGRGLYEPSITKFNNRFCLTLRNDTRGYVAVGDDGLNFGEPRPWMFDDGEELGNYNTQQHWVTHSDGLFLVYTRRGLNNDHIFRHRAPLVMSRVDPDRMCVIRSTERILVPQRGARLGNFAVTDVSPDETWVTVSEWMQTWGPNPSDYTICQKYGSDNAVFAARIKWKKPNRLAV